jgi:hypothetical protein
LKYLDKSQNVKIISPTKADRSLTSIDSQFMPLFRKKLLYPLYTKNLLELPRSDQCSHTDIKIRNVIL